MSEDIAFVDPAMRDDPTPSMNSELMSFESPAEGASGRMERLAPIMAGAALVVVLVLLAYVLSRTSAESDQVDPAVVQEQAVEAESAVDSHSNRYYPKWLISAINLRKKVIITCPTSNNSANKNTRTMAMISE